MALTLRTILTKGEFAKRKHRSPACVSNWLAEGKISQAALVGEGHRARIWLEQAEADLAASLSPNQQWSKDFPANERTSLFPASDTTAPEPVPVSDLELDRARRAKADADKAEYDAEVVRRRLLLDNGRFVLTRDVVAQTGKITTRMMTFFENALVELAAAIASKYSLPQRDVLHVLREEFRKIRARAAAHYRMEAEKLPETYEIETKEIEMMLADEPVSTLQ